MINTYYIWPPSSQTRLQEGEAKPLDEFDTEFPQHGLAALWQLFLLQTLQNCRSWGTNKNINIIIRLEAKKDIFPRLWVFSICWHLEDTIWIEYILGGKHHPRSRFKYLPSGTGHLDKIFANTNDSVATCKRLWMRQIARSINSCWGNFVFASTFTWRLKSEASLLIKTTYHTAGGHLVFRVCKASPKGNK